MPTCTCGVHVLAVATGRSLVATPDLSCTRILAAVRLLLWQLPKPLMVVICFYVFFGTLFVVFFLGGGGGGGRYKNRMEGVVYEHVEP